MAETRLVKLNTAAVTLALRVHPVRGYLVTDPQNPSEGKFCRDLDAVERYLDKKAKEHHGQ